MWLTAALARRTKTSLPTSLEGGTGEEERRGAHALLLPSAAHTSPHLCSRGLSSLLQRRLQGRVGHPLPGRPWQPRVLEFYRRWVAEQVEVACLLGGLPDC